MTLTQLNMVQLHIHLLLRGIRCFLLICAGMNRGEDLFR